MHTPRFCCCKKPAATKAGRNPWFEWDICCHCNKPIPNTQRELPRRSANQKLRLLPE